MTTPIDAAVERASKIDCAALSDALDRMGIAGQCQKVLPCAPNFRMAGRAWTVLYEPATTSSGNVGDYIDDVPAGAIVAIDNRGREDVSTWGNILTEVARQMRIAGTVIDGNARDVALCREINYPIYARGAWMRTGKGRIQIKGTQVPIVIGNVVVNPGDIMRGDADGVLVLPRQHEAELLDIAEGIVANENAIRDCVRKGEKLVDAREKYRYHLLQSRQQ